MIEVSFKNKTIKLIGASLKDIGISRSSLNLASILPNLKGMTVLDIGCGIGYMSIGALLLDAKKVVATDIYNTEKKLRKNLQLNNINQNKLIFYKSYLFNKIPINFKFNVIIANLPQHALPAESESKKLKGKYGGFDGTDLVCCSLTEAVFYLKPGGRYFGSISELTNHQRTLALAKSLYRIKLKKNIEKNIKSNEMTPYLTEEELLRHLKKLRKNKIITFIGDGKNNPIRYQVGYYQFNLKSAV